MNPAPIALFTYNRLWHTQQTVAALANNGLASQSDLFVFSDGPKSEPECQKVREVREYLRGISGFKKITIVEREENLGLSRSIITGVTDIVGRFGHIIVLEDDMITSPHFLSYMNEALDYYQDAEKVISIHGYVYPVKGDLPPTFFLTGADCWGWATWKRGWDIFEPDGSKLLEELTARGLVHRFNFEGSHGYLEMLKNQVNGKNDSWAIRWYASAFLKEKLTLYPGRSLVFNTGTDASGTHCRASDVFATELAKERVPISPIPLEENQHAREAFRRFFLAAKPPFARRVLGKVKKVLGRRT